MGIRFAHYADLMLLFGLTLFTLFNPLGRNSLATNGRVLLFLILGGLALSTLSIVAMTASMAGVAILDVDCTSIWAMISQTPMGAAWSVRMCVLALLAISFVIMRRPTVLASLGAIPLGSLAWTGHGAAGEGNAGIIQLIADVVHLLAAGAWLGAIVGLGSMIWASRNTAATFGALENFASVGTIIVASVIGSGLVNAFYLVGWSNLATLPFTLYGQLLLVKIALVGAMLGVAALNRFKLTPALGAEIRNDRIYPARGGLRLSLILELSLAAAILGLVAWLGTLEPPMSM